LVGNTRLVEGDQVIVAEWSQWKNETGPPRKDVRATVEVMHWVGVSVIAEDGSRARVAHNKVKLVSPLQQLAEASNE